MYAINERLSFKIWRCCKVSFIYFFMKCLSMAGLFFFPANYWFQYCITNLLVSNKLLYIIQFAHMVCPLQFKIICLQNKAKNK